MDLVITDIMMPGMGGPELRKLLQIRWPNQKFLFMSGYSPTAATQEAGTEPDVPYLLKPFRVSELAAKVREVLNA